MDVAVFLDRDNTLIHNDADLGDPEQVRLIQGAAAAVASLRGLGYKIIVVTNQGGVARGKYAEADVEKVHQRVNELVRATSGARIDRFYYCPYHPDAVVEQYRREHPWRKPAPGMLVQAARDMNIDLSQSWMIGDQMRDIQAGAAAGARTILLRADAGELDPISAERLAGNVVEKAEGPDAATPNYTVRNLIEAVRIIAKQRKPEAIDAAREAEERRRKWDPSAIRTMREKRQGGGADMPAARTRPPEARSAEPRNGQNALPAASPAPQSGNLPPPAAPRPPLAPERAMSPAAARPEPAAASAVRPTAAPPTRWTPLAPAAADVQSAAVARSTPAPSAAPEPGAPVPQTTLPAAPGADVTLRQILQEIRNRSASEREFSFTKVIAVVLQMIAVVCLLGGFLMAGDDTTAFLRWASAALVAQLATIAALLFSR